MKILIVEDTEGLLEVLSSSLANEKFNCECATNFESAYEKVMLYQYDVAIIDINLPDGSGLNLIKALKNQQTTTGIIVISARNSLDNKIEGLELGADDYLTKPFEITELIARIRSLVRRKFFSGSQEISYCGALIDVNNRIVAINHQTIELTKSEYDILLFFVANQNRVLTKESIAEHVYGDNMDVADSFDFIYSHVKNIRKKFTQTGGINPFKVVYGVGYKSNNDA